jgi:hypothetical protein
MLGRPTAFLLHSGGQRILDLSRSQNAPRRRGQAERQGGLASARPRSPRSGMGGFLPLRPSSWKVLSGLKDHNPIVLAFLPNRPNVSWGCWIADRPRIGAWKSCSEGKDHTFESCRVRQLTIFHDIVADQHTSALPGRPQSHGVVVWAHSKRQCRTGKAGVRAGAHNRRGPMTIICIIGRYAEA